MPSNPSSTTFDVIVLGAGAAGMMCAFEAGRRGKRVLLLEHSERPGRKILISGGGRCNFTNLHTRPENFLSSNPHFAKSALARFTPADMVDLVDRHDIRHHEKTLGQLFCDDSAQRIVTLLERECAEVAVEIRTSTAVISVTSQAAPASRFSVESTFGSFSADSVVVATGGLSIPKMGATGIGYDIARSFGHTLIEPRAGLVPLVFAPEDHDQWTDLTGLSADTIATASAATARSEPKQRDRTPPSAAFREKLLITHRGLSGPAILQASSYWQPGQPISLDLAPGQNIAALLLTPHARRDPTAVYNELRNILPARMAERWLTLNLPPQATQALRNSPANDALPNATLITLEQRLHDWRITPAGTEGYVKAEVTAGGVSTDELDAKTMQSKKRPNLYFIGEVVDVTGWLGGYNFQWAWASAHAAAQAL